MKTFGVSIVGFLRFLPNSVGLEAMYARKYYCYETDETPQPKANPNQEKIGLNVSHFFFFGGWDWFYVGNRIQETQSNQILREHPIYGGT